MHLEEIKLASTVAAYEPTVDYVVCKVARFPFDKFEKADHELNTQMKATGEVMSIGRNFEESLLKAIRSLEIGVNHLYLEKFDKFSNDDLYKFILDPSDERFFAIAECFRRNFDMMAIQHATKIDAFFLDKIHHIISLEEKVKKTANLKNLKKCKEFGFSNAYLAPIFKLPEKKFYDYTKKHNILPVYKQIDTCAGEFPVDVNYLYSTYEDENESVVSKNKKIIVLGSGPIRIGQGVEFDYSTVHAI